MKKGIRYGNMRTIKTRELTPLAKDSRMNHGTCRPSEETLRTDPVEGSGAKVF